MAAESATAAQQHHNDEENIEAEESNEKTTTTKSSSISVSSPTTKTTTTTSSMIQIMKQQQQKQQQQHGVVWGNNNREQGRRSLLLCFLFRPFRWISTKILFGWAYPLILMGMKKPIEDEDLPQLYDCDTSTYNRIHIENIYKHSCCCTTTTANNNNKNDNDKKKNHQYHRSNNNNNNKYEPYRLGIAIYIDYIKSIWFAQLLLAINMAVRIIQAIALGYLMEQLTTSKDDSDSDDSTYVWAIIMVGCGLIAFPTKQRLYYETYRKGMQLRVGLVAALYHKTLRLPSIALVENYNHDNNNKNNKLPSTSSNSNSSSSSGHVTNLASNDVERFLFTSVASQYLFLGPIEAISILIIGSYTLGFVSFVSGYIVLCISVPIQFYFGRRFASIRSQVATLTDQRCTLVSQAIIGSRIIKMNGWELELQQRILAIRQLEINQISKASYYKAWNESIYYIAQIVVAVTMFTVHVSSTFGGGNNETLTPRKVFTTLSLLSILQFTICKHIPNAIMGLSECSIASRRIQSFLGLVEQQQQPQPQQQRQQLQQQQCDDDDDDDEGRRKLQQQQSKPINDDASHDEYAITMTGVTCYWNNNDINIAAAAAAAAATTMMTPLTTSDHPTPVSTSKDSTVNLSPSEKIGCCDDDDDDDDNNKDPTLLLLESSTTISNSNVALDNINLVFPKTGGLHCIIGKVGSGKSALLQALAGELPISQGRLTRNYIDDDDDGSAEKNDGNKTSSLQLAYATQDPWIMDGTVQENILMGLPMDVEWYNKVIDACGLLPDLQRMSLGDQTVVGDRGVQCSGGQKARIGLARVFYDQNARVLLLDDPLSAVDTKVARKIFYDAIQDLGVHRGKCVILVTHQHQFVSGNCTSCTLLDRGKVVCSGSFSDCVEASGGDISDALQTTKEDDDVDEDDGDFNDEEDADDDCRETNKDNALTVKNENNSIAEKQSGNTATEESSSSSSSKGGDHDAAQLERRTTGILRFSTWLSYGKAIGGILACLAFFVSFSLTQTCYVLTSVEIGKWAELPSSDQSSTRQLGLIFGFTAGVITLAVIRAQLSFALFLGASRRLHSKMVHSVLRAKIEFFDTNPLGRILNRFSADVGISDENLPLTIYDFSVGCFVALASVATSIAVLPIILVAIPPLIMAFLRLRKMFVTTTRELKRLEGMARSPIFAMVSESLGGIATIRSNNKMEYVKQKFQAAHDAHTRAFFAFIASSRWFATQMELLAFTLMAIFVFAAVLFHQQGWLGEIDPAVLGVALTMLLQMTTTNFPWIVRQSAEVTNQMVSIERILEYGDLEHEADLTMSGDESEYSDWPKDTSIAVDNLAIRYRSNLPLALNGISFKVLSGQRVGVVGRTGSGKSSLVQALFRILEAENGSITVGGVDVSNLGLHKLRTNMSVIPQTPILFTGCSIRENLDPFGRYNEEQIRSALEAVDMMETVNDLPGGLDSPVAEGGSNLSMGQRQLLCLSRAILLRNKILVLDEPTANVDMNTDRLLQATLKRQFSDATVISVAHRLDTVIDYDLVLVLEDGKVAEFGSPNDLLTRKEGGYFASMVKNTGQAMSQVLMERAKLAASVVAEEVKK